MPFRLLQLLLLCLLCSGARAQSWVENSDLLGAAFYAYAGPGLYYNEDIVVRAAQQPVFFDLGYNVSLRMEVQVNGGPSSVLHDDSPRSLVHWPGVPTTVGVYQVNMKYFNSNASLKTFAYNLYVVPPAQRAFSDGAGNSMVLWQGTTAALDRPVLIVEGIDASNINSPEDYYALGGALFGPGRERGADVLILNFIDGGRDIRENATVLEQAIGYVRQIKTGSRSLVVAGLSMGGVVARYALARMEQNGVPHGASHFVSIDAPQQGAVLDAELSDWIYYSSRDLVPVPDNLGSTAGKQLLVYNPFDREDFHDEFFQELNALNGDGYPHLTDNVGVSFGTPNPNPNTGQEWLEIDGLPAWPDADFDIQAGSPESQPGSLLPREATELWGRALFGFFEWNFVRHSDPTFIPYASALDIVNGQSRFDVRFSASTVARPHDELPPEVVEPILNRIGFPRPPLAARIDGPSTYDSGVPTSWSAAASGGTLPYGYRWRYTYECSPPPPCTGPVCISSTTLMGPGCGAWHEGGSGVVFTGALSNGVYAAVLEVTVTDDAGGTRRSTRRVTPQAARTGDVAGASARTTEPASSVTAGPDIPAVFAVESVYPNPTRGRAEATLALPERAAARFALYDALGRAVDQGNLQLEAGRHRVTLDLAELPAGMYLLRVEAAGATGSHAATKRLTLVK